MHKKTGFWRAMAAAALVVSAFAAPRALGKTETVGGVEWSYSVANKAATVTGANPKSGALEIPAKLGGYTVKAIGEKAFQSSDDLTSVSIPEGVTSIGDSAFWYCTNLASATLPSTLKTIGGWSFADCESLAGMSLPANVTSIGEQAFRRCLALAEMAIPASVTSIGNAAFRECPLSAIEVAAGNSKYVSVDGVLYTKSKDKLLACPAGKAGAVAIPGTVKSVAAEAFYYCTNVTAVTIPSATTSFGESAFEGCGLKSVVLPKGLASIVSRMFCRCQNLESVTIPDSVTTIAPWAFKECESLQSLALPKKLKSIGHKTFESCVSLPELTIPDSVTSIGIWTFNNCTNLASLTIGKGLTKIDEGLFSSCSSLTDVVIPNTVKTVGDRAFFRCQGLESVTIPASVTSIGEAAFMGCGKLVRFDVASGNGSYAGADGMLFTKSMDRLLCCGGGKSGAVAIPSGVKQIDAYAFEECEEVTSVAMPDSVKNIGDLALSSCWNLRTVRVGGSVTNIGQGAFSGSGLGVLTLPASVKSLGDRALGCYGLKLLVVPASWKGTSKLDNAEVPEDCRVVYGALPADGETVTTEPAVPYAWLRDNGRGGDGTAEGYEEEAHAAAANGRPAWACYVAGLDPADAADDLVAVLSNEDGKLRVRPKGGERPGRTYRVLGKTELDDDWYWRDVTDVEDLSVWPWRFFQLEAVLPGAAGQDD